MKITRYLPSEATIQAELYCALKAAGLRPMLEQIFFLDGKTRTGRSEKIRVDLIVVDATDLVIAAVEIKSSSRVKNGDAFKHTRQASKYQRLELPVAWCTHLDAIPSTVQWILSLLQTHQTGRPPGGGR